MTVSEKKVYSALILSLINTKSLLPRFLGEISDETEIPDWSDYCFASWIISNRLVVSQNTELIVRTIKAVAKQEGVTLTPKQIASLTKNIDEFVRVEFISLIIKHTTISKNTGLIIS